MAYIGEINLEDAVVDGGYAIDYTMGTSKIGDEFTVGSNAARVLAARAKYPYWIAYCSCVSNPVGTPVPIGSADRVPTPGAPQWSDVEILGCSSFVAAWNDAVLKTSGSISTDPTFSGYPFSRANITAPHGSYYVNYPLLIAFGTYTGRGSAQYAPDLNTPLSDVGYGTRLSVWHEEWLDDGLGSLGAPERYIMKSINFPCYIENPPGVWTEYAGIYGASGGSASFILGNVYMEGTRIEGFRFNGRKGQAAEAVGPGGNTYVTTYHSSGLAIWRFGSVSIVRDCLFDDFNNAGVEICSGTPAHFINCRSMFNNYASMWMRGDATCFVTGWECDDCPVVFLCEGFYTPDDSTNLILPPGCNLTVHGLKVETGLTGFPDNCKGTMILDSKGWTRATFHGVNYASNSGNMFPELLCRVNNNYTDWGPYANVASYVEMEGLRVFDGMRTLMHHIDKDGVTIKKWMFSDGTGGSGDYAIRQGSSICNFVYNSEDSGTLTTATGAGPRLMEVAYDNRQNWLAVPVTTPWTDTGTTGTPAYTNPVS